MLRKPVSILLCVLMGTGARVDAKEPIDFRCGTKFRKQLGLPASVYWSSVPLREGLENLARTQRLAIWLDRRVIPDQPVTLAAKQQPLRACFSTLAEAENLDIAWVDCIVYVGADNAADRFATVHGVHSQLVTKLPSDARHRWRTRRASAWPRLTVPAELVAAIEEELGFRVYGQQQIPHDLWPAAQWPSLAAYTRLGLILAGFDLTFLWNKDGSVRIVSMPERPTVKRTYRVTTEEKKTIQKLLASPLKARSEHAGGRIQLTASWRVHEAVRQALDPPEAAQGATLDTRYTLRGVNQPVGPLLEKLVQRLELTCEFSPAARAYYEQRVSFEAREVPRDELFRTILKSTPLGFDVQDGVLRVFEQSEGGRP